MFYINSNTRQDGPDINSGPVLPDGNLDLRSLREVLRVNPRPPSMFKGLDRSEKLSSMECINQALQILDDDDIPLELNEHLMTGITAAAKFLQKKQ